MPRTTSAKLRSVSDVDGRSSYEDQLSRARWRPPPEGQAGRTAGAEVELLIVAAHSLRAGTFEFVNLGDLSWNFQHRLACPGNLLGTLDLVRIRRTSRQIAPPAA
jgi:hypothetical protein